MVAVWIALSGRPTETPMDAQNMRGNKGRPLLVAVSNILPHTHLHTYARRVV